MNKVLSKQVTRLMIKDLKGLTEDLLNDFDGINPYSISFGGMIYTTPENIHSILMKHQKAYGEAKRWLLTEGLLEAEELTLENQHIIEAYAYSYFTMKVLEECLATIKANEELDFTEYERFGVDDLELIIKTLKASLK